MLMQVRDVDNEIDLTYVHKSVITSSDAIS